MEAISQERQQHASMMKEKGNLVKDTTVIKVSSNLSPVGHMGQKYLACGKSLSMRLWENEQPSHMMKPHTARDYETVGYVISGKAELHLEENQMILLKQGDSWVVPKGAMHSYRVLESFTAVEATHPPAEFHNRDEVPSK